MSMVEGPDGFKSVEEFMAWWEAHLAPQPLIVSPVVYAAAIEAGVPARALHLTQPIPTTKSQPL